MKGCGGTGRWGGAEVRIGEGVSLLGVVGRGGSPLLGTCAGGAVLRRGFPFIALSSSTEALRLCCIRKQSALPFLLFFLLWLFLLFFLFEFSFRGNFGVRENMVPVGNATKATEPYLVEFQTKTLKYWCCESHDAVQIFSCGQMAH